MKRTNDNQLLNNAGKKELIDKYENSLEKTESQEDKEKIIQELERELKIYKDIANLIGYEYSQKIYCEDCIASNRCHKGCKCPDLIIDMLHELSERSIDDEKNATTDRR